MTIGVSSSNMATKSVKPKLLPTLVCFAIVALFAALLPYPGFDHQITVIGTDSPK